MLAGSPGIEAAGGILRHRQFDDLHGSTAPFSPPLARPMSNGT
jgi:hypothetical protein